MSFGKKKYPKKKGYRFVQGKKKKSFLSQNKKFTAILLLICLGCMAGVDIYMIVLHDKVCAATGQTPGLLGLWGACPP